MRNMQPAASRARNTTLRRGLLWLLLLLLRRLLLLLLLLLHVGLAGSETRRSKGQNGVNDR